MANMSISFEIKLQFLGATQLQFAQLADMNL